MTFTKTKRILNKKMEELGEDTVLFRQFDSHFLDEHGKHVWKEIESLTVGEIIKLIEKEGLGWSYKTDGHIYNCRDIIKLLERKKLPYPVGISIPESVEKYRKFLQEKALQSDYLKFVSAFKDIDI